jgi:hypothetical protein
MTGLKATMTIALPHDLALWITAHAEKHGISRSKAVCNLLEGMRMDCVARADVSSFKAVSDAVTK